MNIQEAADTIAIHYGKFLNSLSKIEENGYVAITNELQNDYLSESFIAGGAIASLLNNTELNDYDMYFKTKNYGQTVANLISFYMSDTIEVKTKKALLLKDRTQIIYLLHGWPHEIVKTFDFLHCQAYWIWQDPSEIYATPEVLDAINNKTLIYKGSEYPIIALKRVEKFLARGYTISQEEMEKIIDDVKKLYIKQKEVEQEIKADIPLDIDPIEFGPKQAKKQLDPIQEFAHELDKFKAEIIDPPPIVEPAILFLRKKLEWVDEVIKEVREGKFDKLHTIHGLY